MDSYSRRNDRVGYNLSKAESLLDEPDTAGFKFGGDPFGRPTTGNNYGATSNSRIGGGASFAGRSNYTASDMGDSES